MLLLRAKQPRHVSPIVCTPRSTMPTVVYTCSPKLAVTIDVNITHRSFCGVSVCSGAAATGNEFAFTFHLSMPADGHPCFLKPATHTGATVVGMGCKGGCGRMRGPMRGPKNHSDVASHMPIRLSYATGGGLPHLVHFFPKKCCHRTRSTHLLYVTGADDRTGAS